MKLASRPPVEEEGGTTKDAKSTKKKEQVHAGSSSFLTGNLILFRDVRGIEWVKKRLRRIKYALFSVFLWLFVC